MYRISTINTAIHLPLMKRFMKRFYETFSNKFLWPLC